MVTLATFIRDLVVSGAILYATYALMRFVARCLLWLVGSIRFGEGAQASGMPAARTRQPSLPEIKVDVREASDALFAYERRMFCARSEMREIAARTLDAIADTRALIAQVDALTAGTLAGVEPADQSFADGVISSGGSEAPVSAATGMLMIGVLGLGAHHPNAYLSVIASWPC
jgi:hypothetical protein